MLAQITYKYIILLKNTLEFHQNIRRDVYQNKTTKNKEYLFKLYSNYRFKILFPYLVQYYIKYTKITH